MVTITSTLLLNGFLFVCLQISTLGSSTQVKKSNVIITLETAFVLAFS